jgi:hypothetical protein
MKKMLAGAGALLVILSALYVGSPWWATHRMQRAAENGDGEKLAEYVDYPAVTANVESQIAAGLSAKKGLFRVFASQIVGTVAKALVTPENIAALVATGRANPLDAATRQFPDAPDEDAPPRVLRAKRYRSLDVFDMEMLDPETKRRLATLVFHRYGLVGWKLAAIQFAQPPPAPMPPPEPAPAKPAS